MNKNKILIFIGVIVSIFTALIASVNALTIDAIDGIASSNVASGDKEMKNAFGDNYDDFLKNNFYQVSVGEKLESLIKKYYKDSYPSYYGGMYISDDSKNLILQIVKNNIPSKNSDEYEIYNEIINTDNSIMVTYVENSYNDLNNINDEVVNYLKSSSVNKNVFDNYSSNYIDVINNKVVIKLVNNTVEKQEIFRQNVLSSSKVLNILNSKNEIDYSKYITFEKGDVSIPTSNLNAGQQISVHGGYCSMGFRTKYNGKNGYVTAGHCFNGLTPSIATGSIKIRQFNNNQNGDYAFVETNSSYTPTNNLQYTASGITKLAVIRYCPATLVNTAIAKSGMKTGYTAGKITALNVAVKYDSTVINQLIQASLKVNCGDSGGAVFMPVKDSDGGSIPIGIVSGGNPSNDCKTPGTITYFTSINSLPSALQTGTY